MSAIDAELDLAVLFFCYLFFMKIFYFLNSHSVTSYTFFSPVVVVVVVHCAHILLFIYTTSVAGKLVAWSRFHIIEAVPKSHSRRRQNGTFWCL